MLIGVFSEVDGPSVMDRPRPRPLATPRPFHQQRLRSPADRSGPRTHRDGSSLTSENLLDRSLYDLDHLLLLFLRLLWSSTSMTWENTRKSDAGVPISSPASTHLNSERPTSGRYVHFPRNLRLFHLYSRLIYRISALSCCFWRNNVRRKNRLRLNVKTRWFLSDILTSFPLWTIPQLTAQLKYVQVPQTIFKNNCLALFSI